MFGLTGVVSLLRLLEWSSSLPPLSGRASSRATSSPSGAAGSKQSTLLTNQGTQLTIGSQAQSQAVSAFDSSVPESKSSQSGGGDLWSLVASASRARSAAAAHLTLVEHGLEAIASCVLACPLNEDLFLQHGGTFILLDLLEVSNCYINCNVLRIRSIT